MILIHSVKYRSSKNYAQKGRYFLFFSEDIVILRYSLMFCTVATFEKTPAKCITSLPAA